MSFFQRDKKIVMKELVVLAISMISISACRGMSTTPTPKEMSTTPTPTHQLLPFLAIGMTASEVIELLGKPQKTEKEKITGGVAWFWHYLPPAVDKKVELMFWNGELQSWDYEGDDEL
jgi:hypothetical protein